MVQKRGGARLPLKATSVLGVALGLATFTAGTTLSSLASAQPREHRPSLTSGVDSRASSPIASGGDQAEAKDYWCNCRIVQTGPGGGTINIRLHDLAETFPDRWFVAKESSKQQMFEAALAAVIANRSVSVHLRDTAEFSTVEVLYVNAS
jgi:hypothetical protein